VADSRAFGPAHACSPLGRSSHTPPCAGRDWTFGCLPTCTFTRCFCSRQERTSHTGFLKMRGDGVSLVRPVKASVRRGWRCASLGNGSGRQARDHTMAHNAIQSAGPHLPFSRCPPPPPPPLQLSRPASASAAAVARVAHATQTRAGRWAQGSASPRTSLAVGLHPWRSAQHTVARHPSAMISVCSARSHLKPAGYDVADRSAARWETSQAAAAGPGAGDIGEGRGPGSARVGAGRAPERPTRESDRQSPSPKEHHSWSSFLSFSQPHTHSPTSSTTSSTSPAPVIEYGQG